MDDKTLPKTFAVTAGFEIISVGYVEKDGKWEHEYKTIPMGTPEYDEAEKRMEDDHQAYLKAREKRRYQAESKIATLLKGNPVRKVTLGDDGAVILHVDDNHSVKVTTYDEGYEWDVE
jgi:hypothetical protein